MCSVDEDAIDKPPKIECNVLLDEFQTVAETRKAVQQLSSGKAPAPAAIYAEVYKAGATLGRETDKDVSVYVDEGGYHHRNVSHLDKRKRNIGSTEASLS